MIIELVGLPGAGKSTFARSLSGLGKYEKVKIHSSRELLWLNVCFLLRHPIKFFGLFLLYVRYAGPHSLWYTKFTSVFLDYNAKYVKARKCKYALLDQGHMQVLMSLFDTPLSQKKIESIVRFLPKSDHYVFFEIDESTRKERLLTRGYVSRAGMPEQMRKDWQETARTHFDHLRSVKNILSPATVDTIDIATDVLSAVSSYQKAQFMRYITFARMPTEKAHGLQIAKMCEAFTSQNVLVSLITPKRSNTIQKSVDEYYSLHSPLQHTEAPVWDVIGFVSNVRSIHHYLHELLFAWCVLWMRIPKEMIVYTRTPLVSFVRRLRGNRVIAEQHFWPVHASMLHRFLLSSATHIPCNSEGTHKACIEHGLSQSFVAHNGFDESILDEKISQSQARLNLGLPTAGKIVMYIGSLGDWKGVDTLSEAAKSFAEGVIAVVIGGVEDELPAWKEKYPHVQFLGSRPYEGIAQHQRAADILVVPNNPISKESSEYTSPIKLFAHMASGVPLLVSNLPSLRAIVDENEVTFFEAGNCKELHSKIISILNIKIDSVLLSRNAAVSSRNYTWGKRAQHILRVQ